MSFSLSLLFESTGDEEWSDPWMLDDDEELSWFGGRCDGCGVV